MPAAKPSFPILQYATPLSQGLVLGVPLCDGGGSPWECVSNQVGVFGSGTTTPVWAESPLGRCLVWDNSASQKYIAFPGRGYVTAPSQLTFFTVMRLDNTSATPRIVSTTSNGAGVMLEYTGSVALLLGLVAHYYSGITLTAGHWCAVACTYRKAGSGLPGAGTADFYVLDYQTNTWTQALGVAVGGTPINGDGTATLMNNSGNAGLNNIALACAGMTTASWSSADFASFALDPWQIFRRKSWVTSGWPRARTQIGRVSKPAFPVLQAGSPLAKGLVAAYPMHEGSGTVVNDLSGRGAQATLNGGVSWSSGPFGKCLSLDGVNGYALASVSALNVTDATAALWIAPSGAQSTVGLFQWAGALASGSPFVLLQRMNSTTIRWYVDGNYRQSVTCPDGEWHHHAVTLSSSSLWTFYLDGISVGTYSGGTSNRTISTGIYLGNGFNGYASALIDGFLLYGNRALSSQEIAALYRDSWTMFRRRPLTLSGFKIAPIASYHRRRR